MNLVELQREFFAEMVPETELAIAAKEAFRKTSDPGALGPLRELAHKTVGVAAPVGLQEISVLASLVEHFILLVKDGSVKTTPSVVEYTERLCDAFVDALRHGAERVPQHPGAT